MGTHGVYQLEANAEVFVTLVHDIAGVLVEEVLSCHECPSNRVFVGDATLWSHESERQDVLRLHQKDSAIAPALPQYLKHSLSCSPFELQGLRKRHVVDPTTEKAAKLGNQHLRHLFGLWLCNDNSHQLRAIGKSRSHHGGDDRGFPLSHVQLHDSIAFDGRFAHLGGNLLLHLTDQDTTFDLHEQILRVLVRLPV